VCRQVGEAAGAVRGPGGAEETTGELQRRRVQTAGHRASGLLPGQVGSARQTRQAVHEHDDVFARFDEPMGAGHQELSVLQVVLGAAVIAGADDLSYLGAAEVRHLFRPLIHEEDEPLGLRILPRNGLRDVPEQRRLPRERLRDDEAALAESERSEEVDGSAGEVFLTGLQADAARRRLGGEAVELRPRLGGGRRLALDRQDLADGGAALPLGRRTPRRPDALARAQAELADQPVRDEEVLTAWVPVRIPAEEAMTLRGELEDALDGLLSGGSFGHTQRFPGSAWHRAGKQARNGARRTVATG
jgi:hypothetical protein